MDNVRTIADALASETFVSALRQIVDAVDEHRLPPPASLISSPDLATVYLTSGDDLLAWVIAFDLPAPDWRVSVNAGADKVTRQAYYFPTDDNSLSFALYATEVVHVNIDGETISEVGRPLVASDFCSDALRRSAREFGYVADPDPRVVVMVDPVSFAHCCDATAGVTR